MEIRLNVEAMENEIKIIEFLYKNFSNLVTQLKQSTHSVDDTFLGTKQFHMEDSVWTHTMMALHSAVFYNYDLEGLLTTLTHDFGKPIAQQLKNNKYVFYNHGEMGTQLAADYLLSYQRENSDLTDDMIKRILYVVSNHNYFFDVPIEKIPKFVNYDLKLLECFKKHLLVDNVGRISSLEKFPDYIKMFKDSNKFNLTFEVPKSEIFERNINFICGPSNVGKDTFAKNNNLPIASLDKSRVELYLHDKKLQNTDFDSINTYKKAYSYSTQNFDKVLSIFYKSVDKLVKENNNIAICNTFCNKKNRVGILTSLKNKYHKENIGFHCKYIISHSEFIINNAKKNEEKEIPIEIVNKFLSYQHLPTMLEGFDTVEIILKK